MISCSILDGRAVICCDPNDQTLTPWLRDQGLWETAITRAIQRCTGPGMTVIDIGANVGYFTAVLALQVGPGGRVLALEPNPSAYALLVETIRRNGFRQVEPMQVGAWNASGAGLLSLRPQRLGDASLVLDWRGDHTQVPLARLDDLVSGWGQIDFVKIDVEGAEVHVLEGMHDTLLHVQELVVEYGQGRGYDVRWLLSILSRAGFHFYGLLEDGGLLPGTFEQAAAVETLANVWCRRW